MIEFELKHYQATGTVQYNVNNNTFEQYVNVLVGVKGTPDNPKYFYPQVTILYVFDAMMPTIQALSNMENFCKQWVKDNYPDINN